MLLLPPAAGGLAAVLLGALTDGDGTADAIDLPFPALPFPTGANLDAIEFAAGAALPPVAAEPLF